MSDPKPLKELLEEAEASHLGIPAPDNKTAEVRGRSYRSMREMARRLRLLDKRHYEVGRDKFSFCGGCEYESPCPDRRILDGGEE